MFEAFEDRIRQERRQGEALREFVSPYQDFRLYSSSVTPGIKLGLNVIKPERPGPILATLHGWHMSMPPPERRELPAAGNRYLLLQIDMRGRAFSEGTPDGNGFELMDVYDAIQFARKEYAAHIDEPAVVYLEGGSGGGGNALAAAGKFPDLFAAVTALYGISDYRVWYENDLAGEFRDEMDVWIGCAPSDDPERYLARSGRFLAPNLHTPLYLAHGDGDIRVPVAHARMYAEAVREAGKTGLLRYEELAGVGGRGHLDGATAARLQELAAAAERHRREHAAPIELPRSGTLRVGGFLYAKPFRVTLESNDRVAELSYDVPRGRYRLTAAGPYRYMLETADGLRREGVCETRRPNEEGTPGGE